MGSVHSSVKKAEGKEDDTPCRVMLPFPTYLLTYPGRVDFPEGYEDWMKELKFGGAAGNMGNGMAVVAKTTGDDMQIELGGMINVLPICEKLMEHLKNLGFTPGFEELGCVRCDTYDVNKLRRI